MTKYETVTTDTYIYHTRLDCEEANKDTMEELCSEDLERYPYRPCSHCGFDRIPTLD